MIRGAAGVWLGFAGVLLLAAAGLGALGHLPVRRQGGEALWGLWLGCAVSFAAAAAGSVPLARLVRRHRAQDPDAANDVIAAVGKATLVRFAVSLAGAGWLLASDVVAMRPLLTWLAISYLVLLAVETWWLLRALRPGQIRTSHLGA